MNNKRFSNCILDSLFLKKNCWFMLILCLLVGGPLTYLAFMSGTVFFAITLFLALLLPTWLATLIICNHRSIKRYVGIPFLAITTCWSYVNVICVHKFKALFTGDYFSAAKETNAREIEEFFETYISPIDLILWCIPFILLYYIIIRFKSHFNIRRKLTKWTFALSLVFSGICFFHHYGMIQSMFSNWTQTMEDVVDLRKHIKPIPALTANSSLPDNVILIIGESYSKKHSQLYGYSRETNVRLIERLGNGLFCFTNVQSPAANTSSAFKMILNSHTIEDQRNGGGKKWYDSYTIIEMLHELGYTSYWFSNQEEASAFDNVPCASAKLCRYAVFNPKDETGLDGYLLSVDKSVNMVSGKKFICYHLMGQHSAFNKRYPSDMAKFTEKDYPDSIESQRKTLAEYDNATLYNDYIVDSLIRKYETTNSLVVYFADHGLDAFDSAKDYFGHANATPESQFYGKQIPFIVYVSPKYAVSNPKIAEFLKARMDKPFCTDHFFFLLMDMLDCTSNIKRQ